ncbi:branched-chain amino acid ABC transporter permease [Rugosimonospora africana]|uniref:Branched-chain amino acid ABC transporter permease n=1 Tax=Rugosimonospora africana TaxID=556532 RepID=A0A8J3VPX9_9ACTN|nr:branched-chain amino acid ABC transporter permease [Rugosimonospora africana]GIH14575.1 branched-chain amino acid ABC transporter permease [Rugosimonospora africana]
MAWVNAVVQGILLGGLYALFACGLSIVFGVMRIVNLAHGDFAVLAAFLAYSVADATGLGPFWAGVIVIPVLAAVGYLLQRVLLQRSLGVGPLATLLATFGLSVIIQNVLLQTYSADARALDIGRLASASLRISGQLSISYLALITFVLAVVVLVGLQLYLSRTRTGRMLRASSDDPEAARLVGADSRHLYGIATSIAFATVALAGVMFAMRSSFDPSIGPTRLIFAFEAVVIGGLGSLWGTLVGGMVLGLAQTVAGQFDPALTLLAGHVIFLAVLAFRPQGLIPARST